MAILVKNHHFGIPRTSQFGLQSLRASLLKISPNLGHLSIFGKAGPPEGFLTILHHFGTPETTKLGSRA